MRKQIMLVASLLALSSPAVFGQAKDALYKSLRSSCGAGWNPAAG
jgi:hypothetical protein